MKERKAAQYSDILKKIEVIGDPYDTMDMKTKKTHALAHFYEYMKVNKNHFQLSIKLLVRAECGRTNTWVCLCTSVSEDPPQRLTLYPIMLETINKVLSISLFGCRSTSRKLGMCMGTS